MNLGELIYNLDYNNKKLIRKIENLNKKLNNINNSIVFNELCIKEELLPKFTNIYIYIYIYLYICIFKYY